MAVLVAGGAGFLGSHLVDRLARDEAVVVFDDLSTGRIANLERALGSRRAVFVYADVTRDAADLDALYRRATSEPLHAVYHLAASDAGPSWRAFAANGAGTMQLVRLAARHEASFTFASSRAAAGPGKRFAEAAVALGSREFGIDARIVRIANAYGPRMESAGDGLVPALLRAARDAEPLIVFGDGSQTLAPLFVADVIDGIAAVAASPIGVDPVELCGGREYPVLEIARIFARIVHVDLALEFAPPRPRERLQAAVDLARSIGWSPRTELEEGLCETFASTRFEQRGYARSVAQ